MGDSTGEKRGLGELVDIQGLPPPDSSLVCPGKKAIKQRWQEACTDEQDVPD